MEELLKLLNIGEQLCNLEPFSHFWPHRIVCIIYYTGFSESIVTDVIDGAMEKIKSSVNAELRSPTIVKTLTQSLDSNSYRGGEKSMLTQNYVITNDQFKAGKKIYLEDVIFISELAW